MGNEDGANAPAPISWTLRNIIKYWGRAAHLSLFRIQVETAIRSHLTLLDVVNSEITDRIERWKAANGREPDLVTAEQLTNASEDGRTGFIGRAVYVVAWTAFEDLIGSCVRGVMLKEPARLVERLKEAIASGDKGVPLAALTKLLKGMAKDALVADLVEQEVGSIPFNVRKEKMSRFARYLKHVLEVEVDERRLEPIKVVRNRRNAAAHEPHFSAPAPIEVRRELMEFLVVGEAIAKAIAERHSLPQV